MTAEAGSLWGHQAGDQGRTDVAAQAQRYLLAELLPAYRAQFAIPLGLSWT